MDFAKLTQNEKLAVYGSVAVVIGALVGWGFGISFVAVLAAIGMLAVVFLPQLSPNTSLPGSKGSLLLLTGGVAAVAMVLSLLIYLDFIFTLFGFRDLLFLIAVAGSLVMAFAGWQAFQAEGGKFQVGTTSSGAPTTAPPPAAPTDTGPADTAPAGAPDAAAYEPRATDAPAEPPLAEPPPAEAPRPPEDDRP